MPKSIDSIRVLLVQARNTPDMEVQEQECFLERLNLGHQQLDSLNITRSAVSEDILGEYDALFIGGAGEYSAFGSYPWMSDLTHLIQAACRTSFPTFGSCWGHQVIARALGGTVAHDPDRAEMGCHPVELTPEGINDPLLGSFPARFLVNMGHHDRVTALPAGAVELARNDSQPFQAFRMRDQPIFGTQFHSELNAHRERERLIRYRPYYLDELPDEEVFERVLAGLADTTEVDHLMADFLSKFVLE